VARAILNLARVERTDPFRDRCAVRPYDLDPVTGGEIAVPRLNADGEQARAAVDESVLRAFVDPHACGHVLAEAQPELERRLRRLARDEARPVGLAGCEPR